MSSVQHPHEGETESRIYLPKSGKRLSATQEEFRGSKVLVSGWYLSWRQSLTTAMERVFTPFWYGVVPGLGTVPQEDLHPIPGKKKD